MWRSALHLVRHSGWLLTIGACISLLFGVIWFVVAFSLQRLARRVIGRRENAKPD